ncbi:transcriptional regulator [Aureimonas endophytica]|uniref:Transcriptional regulator n=1 Tax=Aureimonas endophytica TaxID=2027858 RepID=A0A916ZZJ1_9HYPH|nr:AraC family transcriptional regulator [Aureimonas endophytica]GGE20183.1 transcriptional regulator [Aureimonas endophytica]
MTRNTIKVWHAPEFGGAEMLKGTYVRHAYPWHAHEDLSLGLVMGGAIELRTRTGSGLATAGSFVLINSEELHRGSPAGGDGWICRTIHVHPEAIRAAADEQRTIGRRDTASFKGPTFRDAELTQLLLDLHRQSERGGSALQRQSLFVALLSSLLERHVRDPINARSGREEPRAVALARSFLDENLSDKVTLDELACEVGLTPFRLLRSFQKATGITPHQYQLQARVRQAHARLRLDESLAEIALDVGFADQAHMTRVFKAIMGATPGQFRMAANRGSVGHVGSKILSF